MSLLQKTSPCKGEGGRALILHIQKLTHNGYKVVQCQGRFQSTEDSVKQSLPIVTVHMLHRFA